MNGTSDNDTLSGTSGNDSVAGMAGDDSATANAGNDTITGGAGNDILFGGDGADSLFGGDGNDTVDGGAGNDFISEGGAGTATTRSFGYVNNFDGPDPLLGATQTLTNGAPGAANLTGDADPDREYVFVQANSPSQEGVLQVNPALMGERVSTINMSLTLDMGSQSGADWVDGFSFSLGNPETLSVEKENGLLSGLAVRLDPLANLVEIRWNGAVIQSLTVTDLETRPAGTLNVSVGSDGRVDVFLPGSSTPDLSATIPGDAWSTADQSGWQFVFAGRTGSNAGFIYMDDVNLQAEVIPAVFGGDDSLFGATGDDTLLGNAGNDVIDGGSGADSIFGGDGDDVIFGGTDQTFSFTSNYVLYLNDRTNDLFRVTFDASGNATKTLVGRANRTFLDIAQGADGTLYGVEGGALFRIDTNTAQTTFVGLIGDGSSSSALSFGADGLLYSSNGSSILRFDPNTPQNTSLFWTNPDGGAAAGDFLTIGNEMFVSWVNTSNTTQLLRLSLDPSGNVTNFVVLGTLPSESFGLALGPNGEIYSATSNNLLLLTVPSAPIAGGTGAIQVTTVSGASNPLGDTYFGATSSSETSFGIEPDRADTIFGGAGNDAIASGAGNDSVFGGDGNDTINGGIGDDTLSGGDGRDTFVLQNGGGTDRITDFNIARIDGQSTDRLDVSDLTDAGGNLVNWEDVVITDTVGDGSGDAVLSFPNGETIILTGVSPAAVAGKANLVAMGIPCFAAGTLIRTPRGWRLVESLKQGDIVETQDHGMQPILWCAMRRVERDEIRQNRGLLPVHIRAGALGNRRDLRLSGQHAVLMRLDGEDVLVRAIHLARHGFRGIRVALGVRCVEYHHLLLPKHAILDADGLPAESFYPGPNGLAMLSGASRLDIAARICRGRSVTGEISPKTLAQIYGPPARRIVNGRDVRKAIEQGRLQVASGAGSRDFFRRDAASAQVT